MPIDIQTTTQKLPSLFSGQSSDSTGYVVSYPAQDDILAFESRDTVSLSSNQQASDIPGKTADEEEKQTYEVPENPLRHGDEEDEEKPVAPPALQKPGGEPLTASERMEVADLRHRDKEIRAHEKAHLAAAAAYAQSGATYEYEKGPDGKSYAIHGHVMIDSSSANTPEATIKKMKVVRRAALAPASPSPQDLKVATSATRRMTKAAQQLRIDKLEDAKKEFKKQMRTYEKVEKNIEEEQKEKLDVTTSEKKAAPEKLDSHTEPLMRFHVKSYHQSLADIAKYQYSSLELYT